MYTAKAENSNISLFHEYDVTCVQVQQVILDCHRVLACIRLEAFVVATTASWESLVRAIIEVSHIHRKS